MEVEEGEEEKKKQASNNDDDKVQAMSVTGSSGIGIGDALALAGPLR